MLIFMENLQWISQEISFPSAFQLRAICSLGICSSYNQLCKGYIIIFQWKVQHDLTCSGMPGTQDMLSFWKNNSPLLDRVMLLASLTGSSSQLQADALHAGSFPRAVSEWRCLCGRDVAWPFSYIPCCLVAESVSPSSLYPYKSLESGLSVNPRWFI